MSDYNGPGPPHSRGGQELVWLENLVMTGLKWGWPVLALAGLFWLSRLLR